MYTFLRAADLSRNVETIRARHSRVCTTSMPWDVHQSVKNEITREAPISIAKVAKIVMMREEERIARREMGK